MSNFLKSLSSVAIIMLLIFLCFSFAIPKNKDLGSENLAVKNSVVDFCLANSGKYLNIDKGDGSFFGVCNFDDGSSCDDWAFFTKKCQKGNFGDANLTDIYCEDNSYSLDCICKEGTKQAISCPEGKTCPAVVQYECVK